MKFLKRGRKSTNFVPIWKETVPVGLLNLKSGMVSQNMLPCEIVLTEEMGGEIADLIRNATNKAYSCIGASSEHYEAVGPWYGYPHPSGIVDKNGMKWWMYQKCTMSNYKTAWWKVLRMATRIVELTQ